MFISFTINSPPFSINQAYYKRSKTRTQECRKWGDNILVQFQDPHIALMLQSLRESFEPSKHSIFLNLTFLIPRSKFYTKKGEISRHSMDLSNIEKMFIDLIFDTRFHGRTINGVKISNLAIDDKYITRLTSTKQPTDYSPQIQVEIGLQAL